MGRLGRQLTPLYRAIREDIFAFCRLLNFLPSPQQQEFFEAIQCGRNGSPIRCSRCRQTGFAGPHKRVAVKSGQGAGKTASSVIAGVWRAFCAENAQTVVTAPTMRQAKDIWVAEARKIFAQADPLIQRLVQIDNSRVVVAGRRDWGVELITATKPENAAGKHNDHLTYIIEEATGVARDIVETIEGTLTNEDALLIAISNPTTRDSAYFEFFHSQRARWFTLTYNCEVSPFVSKEHIEYIATKYGRNSDVFRVRVLGEFPENDPNVICSLEDLEACTKTNVYEVARIPRWLTIPELAGPAKQFGLDFARFGSDESAIARRTGNAIIALEPYVKREPAHIVDRAFLLQAQAHWTDAETYHVPDAGGMGQGVLVKFHEAGKHVHEFHFGGTPRSREYENKATEAWFNVASQAKQRRLWLPNDQRLLTQLANRQYHMTKDGKIIVESKEDYQKRGVDEGNSPDRADAVVMAMYDDFMAAPQIARHK